MVYIIYSEKLNRFYIGTTDHFSERLKKHNEGYFEDAFSVKGVPWEEFLIIDQLSSSQALKMEKHIKSMKSSTYIRNLKKYSEMVEKLILRFK